MHPGAPLSNLGDLAQKAREKPLRHARGWLFFIGIMTMLFNLFLLVNLPNEVRKELENQRQKLAAVGMALTNPQQVETAMYAFGYAIYGGAFLLGVVFVVLACLMLRFPLVASVTSMTLFVLVQIGFGLLEPANIYSGFLVKIIVFFVLLNAIKAAVAYEKNKREAVELQPGY